MAGYQKNRRNQERQRQKDKDRKSAYERADWQGFLPCVLTPEDKAQIDADRLIDDFGSVANLDQFLTAYYKITFSLDPNNDTYVCSMTDTDANSDFGGYCLTGRGPTLLAAFASLMYKHTVKLAEGWDMNVRAIDDYS